MLRIVLKNEMQRRGLSSHGAADAIGVSHTTILRALRGDVVDLETVIRIANFLGMKPSELLNSMSGASLADQISVLLSHSRELEDQFREAVARVNSGEIDPQTFRDVVGYALYKFGSGEKKDALSDKPVKPKPKKPAGARK